MPNIVVAGPGEILGVRFGLERELERATPVPDHPEPTRILGVSDPGVERRVLPHQLLGAVGRLVVDAHQPEVLVGLEEQRLDRLSQLVGVVVQRRADRDPGGAHVRTRRHPTTCL